jgi:hypothetical protein
MRRLGVRSGKTGVTIFPRPSVRTPPETIPRRGFALAVLPPGGGHDQIIIAKSAGWSKLQIAFGQLY